MFEAQLLFEDSVVLGPWFPRQADWVRLTLDVVAIAAATIKVELFTKSMEDPGDGSNADSAGTPTAITATATGRTTTEWKSATVGLKELCRYKFTVTGSGEGEWVLFRMLAPVWFDSVKV